MLNPMAIPRSDWRAKGARRASAPASKRWAAVAGVVAIVLTPGTAMGGAASHTSQHKVAPVTWSGWRGVHFNARVSAAHRRLGGTYYHIRSTGYGCGDSLTVHKMKLDGNVYKHPHRIGTISGYGRVGFPMGIRASMSPGKIKRHVRASPFALHTKRVDPYGTGEYDHLNWVVGPHHHTFYFVYHSNEVYRIGVSATPHTARAQMEINGC